MTKGSSENSIDSLLDAFIERHRLPEEFARTANDFYLPVVDWVVDTQRRHAGNGAYVLGINGAQGTGKSTLADFICDVTESRDGMSVATVSIDDLYLRRSERAELADKIHPLLATRGVPGTHDVAMGVELINTLKSLGDGSRADIPRFDKAQDDRCAASEWTHAEGPLDLIIFEGWCVGSQASAEDDLETPINALEETDDPDAVWRKFVDQQLADVYPPLFSLIDGLIFLAAPDFDCVYRWRAEQEQKLNDARGLDGEHVMDDIQIGRFIQHYERITRRNLECLPALADVRLVLAEDHQVVAAHY